MEAPRTCQAMSERPQGGRCAPARKPGKDWEFNERVFSHH